MSLVLTDDKATLIQVMAWCYQTTSHCLSQCCPSSLSLHGITRPQWVKGYNIRLLSAWLTQPTPSPLSLSDQIWLIWKRNNWLEPYYQPENNGNICEVKLHHTLSKKILGGNMPKLSNRQLKCPASLNLDAKTVLHWKKSSHKFRNEVKSEMQRQTWNW